MFEFTTLFSLDFWVWLYITQFLNKLRVEKECKKGILDKILVKIYDQENKALLTKGDLK